VVLESLAPAECVAFVLHDIFAMPFEEIAPIVVFLASDESAFATGNVYPVDGGMTI